MSKIAYIFVLVLLVNSVSCKKSTFAPIHNGTVVGCGDFVLHKKIADDKIVSININNLRTTFSTDYQTYENIGAEDFADIKVQEYKDADALMTQQCNDVLTIDFSKVREWRLVRAKFTYRVSKVLSTYQCAEIYTVDAVLENAVFQKMGSDKTISIDSISFDKVEVGWCAG